MKKSTMTKIALILIPLVTAFVVSGPNSVTVFDGENTWYLSWMTPISDSRWGWCAPVAALGNYLMFGMAALYLVTKKKSWLKGIWGVGFAAICIAALPIVMQGDVMIVPNVLGMLLIAAESIVAYFTEKMSGEQEEKPAGKRLEKH